MQELCDSNRRCLRKKKNAFRKEAEHMTQRKTKAQLVERLQTERRRLEQNLARLTAEQMVQPGVVGAWSTKDVLAHLAAWEALCLSWLDTSQQGGTPAVPAAGFTWGTIDALNQHRRLFGERSGGEQVERGIQ
jgi:hypothetical protein